MENSKDNERAELRTSTFLYSDLVFLARRANTLLCRGLGWG